MSGEPTRWRTSFASQYPPAFCRRFAGLLWDAAEDACWRPFNEAKISLEWEQQLATASKQVISEPLCVVPLPKEATLGWEGARGQWGGQSLKWEIAVLREHRRPGCANRQACKGTTC